MAVARGADIIVCDDGLQHLRLARDVEVAVVDAARGLGNGLLLPAGPLREPRGRLARVDAVVFTVRSPGAMRSVGVRAPRELSAELRVGGAVNLCSGERQGLAAFRGRTLHAVAGIGNPQAFFEALRAAGLEVEEHALADHAALHADALPFPAGATVLMTEKDAVKCRRFARPEWWFVELEVTVDDGDARALVDGILERAGIPGAGVNHG